MLTAQQQELLLMQVASLSREQIVAEIRRCPARFPIDLTDEWMNRQPLEDLRHIFAAICMQCGHLPRASCSPRVRPAA